MFQVLLGLLWVPGLMLLPLPLHGLGVVLGVPLVLTPEVGLALPPASVTKEAPLLLLLLLLLLAMLLLLERSGVHGGWLYMKSPRFRCT
jgi:hypothetical protein